MHSYVRAGKVLDPERVYYKGSALSAYANLAHYSLSGRTSFSTYNLGLQSLFNVPERHG